jgi:hypothetical protein
MLAIVCLALLVASVNTAFSQSRTIPANSTIYVDEMDNDLDGFIRAELVKQQVPLRIVLSDSDAALILTGTSQKGERRSWHEGWLTNEKDHSTANIMVVDKTSKSMLWATEAGDRSWFWGSLARGGERKVASRLVKNLKKAIAPAGTQ